MSRAAEQMPTARHLDALECDEEGFLLDSRDWHPGLMRPLAAETGLPLTEERCDIIRYIRDYFERPTKVFRRRESCSST
jgi:sulfur relay (sulfurtransferase) DsrC/TusE family protein